MVSEEGADIIGDRLPLRRDPVWKNANCRPSAPDMSSTMTACEEAAMPSAHPKPHRRGRAATLPPELRRVNLNAAGVDVGAGSHYVAVPDGRDPEGCDVREFRAFTADLYALADWLTRCDIETVAMESTGVYWIPLFELLSARGFEVRLVDPRQLKSVPGRKTDVLDCQWIQRLHTFGLLAAAFRPDDQICVLRSYLRPARDARDLRLPPYSAHAEGPRADEPEAGSCRQRHHRGDRPGDHPGDPRRAARSPRARHPARPPLQE
jgi:Transposase